MTNVPGPFTCSCLDGLDHCQVDDIFDGNYSGIKDMLGIL